MRLLLLKLSALALLTGSCLAGLFLFAASRDYSGDPNFICAVVDKAERLRSLPSPKALFVGGSNTAFNQDTRELEKALGLRAYNLGMHASIGLSWMLAQAEESLGPGDLAVIIPEYEQFESVYEGGATLTEALLTYPAGFRHLRSWRQLRTLPESVIPRLETNFFWWLKKDRVLAEFQAEPWYRRDAFDDRGDVTAHLRPEHAAALKAAAEKLRSNSAGLRPRVFGAFADEARALSGLNAFAAAAKARGAAAVLSFPCLSRPVFEANESALSALEARLRAGLTMPVLGSVGDCTPEPDRFLDSSYHLLPESRAANTARLAALLRRAGAPRRNAPLQSRR